MAPRRRFSAAEIRGMRYDSGDADHDPYLALRIEGHTSMVLFAAGIGRDDADEVIAAAWRVAGVPPLTW